MTPDQPTGPSEPRFDPRRSNEIRTLLTETVSHSPRPRVARLSRARFALAATAALLFAGGAGAATVVAYNAVSDSTLAQQSSPESADSAESADGTESADGPESDGTPATSSDFTALNDSGESAESALIPFVTLSGETGYAYASEVESAQAAAAGALLDAAADAEPPAAPTRVPIYRSDGTTVLGYYEFAPQGTE